MRHEVPPGLDKRGRGTVDTAQCIPGIIQDLPGRRPDDEVPRPVIVVTAEPVNGIVVVTIYADLSGNATITSISAINVADLLA